MTKEKAKDTTKETEIGILRGNQSMKTVEKYLDSRNVDEILKENLEYLNNESFENDLQRLIEYERKTFNEINTIITQLEIKHEKEKLEDIGSAKSLKYEEAIAKTETVLDEFRIAANNKYIQTIIEEATTILQSSENTSEIIAARNNIQEASGAMTKFDHFSEEQGWTDPNQEINAGYRRAMNKTHTKYDELEQLFDSKLISSYNQNIENIIKPTSKDIDDLTNQKENLENNLKKLEQYTSQKLQEISKVIADLKDFSEQQKERDPKREINANYEMAINAAEAKLRKYEQRFDSKLIRSYDQSIKNIIEEALLDITNVRTALENRLEKVVVGLNSLGQERKWDDPGYIRHSRFKTNLANAYALLDVFKVLAFSQSLSETRNAELINSQQPILPEHNDRLPLSTLYSKLDQLNAKELSQTFENLLSESKEFTKNTGLIKNLKKLTASKDEESNVLIKEGMSEVNKKFISKIIDVLADKSESTLRFGKESHQEANLRTKEDEKLSLQDTLPLVRAMLSKDFIQSNSQWKNTLEVVENKALHFELNSIYKLVDEALMPSSGRFFAINDESTKNELQKVRALANVGTQELSTEELVGKARSIKKLLSHEGFFNRCKLVFKEIRSIIENILSGKSEKTLDSKEALGFTGGIKEKAKQMINDTDTTSVPPTSRKWRI